MKRLLLATAATLGIFSSAQADVFVNGDAEAGKTKAAACAGCHGVDGNSLLSSNPKLAGQNAKYVVAQLQYFKSGERDNAVMKGMAAGLSDQDMADIAAYYAAQTPKVGAADETLVHRGEQIYRGGDKEASIPACIGCHGPQGEGNPGSNYPALSGQHEDYVRAQLYAYRKEQRVNPKADIMMGVTRYMSDKDIDAVSSYIQGLH